MVTLYCPLFLEGREEDLVKEVRAPEALRKRHFSACFVTVGDSVVAIGGYNQEDQRKSVQHFSDYFIIKSYFCYCIAFQKAEGLRYFIGSLQR